MIVNYKQSIFDLSIKNYGSLDKTIALIRQNRLNFDDELTTGQVIETPTQDLNINESLVAEFMLNKQPNNGDDIVKIWVDESGDGWADSSGNFWEWE